MSTAVMARGSGCTEARADQAKVFAYYSGILVVMPDEIYLTQNESG